MDSTSALLQPKNIHIYFGTITLPDSTYVVMLLLTTILQHLWYQWEEMWVPIESNVDSKHRYLDGARGSHIRL